MIENLGLCTLRALTSEDASHLAHALALIDPWARAGYREETFYGFLTHEEAGASKQVIDVDGERAGVVVVRPHFLHGPYLQLLGVLPPFQSRGVGGRLLQWFEESAPQRSRNLWVVASSFNEGAIRFYLRFGFEKVAMIDELAMDGINEVLMRKRLY